jgi:lipopolysaccharide export LptBFGC system permease protein LptF
MRKKNNKIKSGVALIVAVILMGSVLQGFFQNWINEQNVENKILLAFPLVASCLIGCFLMLKGSAESMVRK